MQNIQLYTEVMSDKEILKDRVAHVVTNSTKCRGS